MTRPPSALCPARNHILYLSHIYIYHCLIVPMLVLFLLVPCTLLSSLNIYSIKEEEKGLG
jgi:hypothetical protein